MTPSPASRSELEHQRGLLSTTIGSKGSGAMRYAAAMYFYNMAMISGEMLEIYRTCSKFDREDPNDVAIYEGVALPSLDLSCASDRSA